MGWIVGVAVIIGVLWLVLRPLFRADSRPRTPLRPPTTPVVAAHVLATTTPVMRRVVVRAPGTISAVQTPPAARPTATAPAASADDTRQRERDAVLAQERRALDELDFEHELGAVSDTDYAELRQSTVARIAALKEE